MKKYVGFAGSLAIGLAARAMLPDTASATVWADPAGDFLPTYVGPHDGDLDVLSLDVKTLGTDFLVTATLAGPTGAAGTVGGFYVFGVNRGAGTAGFAAFGLNKVLFDRVIIVRNDGTGLIPGVGPLAPSAFSFVGNTVNLKIPFASLTSTGFDPYHYGWNLWPRAPGTGFSAISDFAPNNATIAAAPEPATWALMLLGLGLAGAGLRRHRATI